MSRDFPVKGLKELDAFLSALPKNMQRNAYAGGLRAAAAVVRDEARLRAPKGATGKMAKAIKSGSVHNNANGSQSIFVRLDPKGNDHAFLGLFHEYGVKPHYIAAGDSGLSARKLTSAAREGGTSDVASQSLKIGDKFISGGVLHPGHIAKPFMRPALDVKAEEATKAFADKIWAYLEGKTGFAAPTEEAA